MSQTATIESIPTEPLTGAALEQYDAVRNGGAGWRERADWGLIQVSGTEAIQFLNGLITNDIKTLEDGQWMSAAFPNVQGRLIASVRVLHVGDAFLFETESASHDAVYQSLYRFSFAGDFKVADLTETTTQFSVQGSDAARIIEAMFGGVAAAIERGRVVSVDGTNIIRATHSGEDGFDIFVERLGAPALRQKLADTTITEISVDVWNVLRIEAGEPQFDVDMAATNVVLEAVADDAVSYTKGCYVGQEIIARIHWRGHVAKKLTGLKIAGGPVAPEDKLFSVEGKEIGRVTSAVYSPALDQWVALGYVKYDFLAAGTELQLKSSESEFPAVVAELPLVRGSWYEPAADAIAL
ncbi:MAG: glycine cleavage T C-terminal barrel domain-containing protein [Pyrinomonadaceae bacterium]